MNTKNEQLQNVVEYSETMLKNAQAGNWDSVIDIEVQRGELLKNLFSGSPQNNNVAEMDAEIRKIISINEKLEAITMNAREDARNDLASANKGRHAVDLYAQNSA
mgnify:CR=1 FL=1